MKQRSNATRCPQLGHIVRIINLFSDRNRSLLLHFSSETWTFLARRDEQKAKQSNRDIFSDEVKFSRVCLEICVLLMAEYGQVLAAEKA